MSQEGFTGALGQCLIEACHYQGLGRVVDEHIRGHTPWTLMRPLKKKEGNTSFDLEGCPWILMSLDIDVITLRCKELCIIGLQMCVCICM